MLLLAQNCLIRRLSHGHGPKMWENWTENAFPSLATLGAMSCVMAAVLPITQSHCTTTCVMGGMGEKAFRASQPRHSTWNPDVSYEAPECPTPICCSTATYPTRLKVSLPLRRFQTTLTLSCPTQSTNGPQDVLGTHLGTVI